LEHPLPKGVVGVGGCGAEDAKRSQAVCIIVNICCSRAICRFLRNVAVVVVCESGRALAICDLCGSVGVRVRHPPIRVSTWSPGRGSAHICEVYPCRIRDSSH
jgi:hypothetical protein